ADIRDESGQERAASHEVGPHVARVAVTEVLLDGFDERLVRGDVLLVTAAEQHRRAVVVDVAREFGGEPALADAGVASDQQEAPLRSVDGALPRRSQRLEL